MIKPVVHVHIGDVVVSREPVMFSTVLGSCVSVCIHDTVSKISGIIHFALPESPEKPDENLNRYGNRAIPALINRVRNLGDGTSNNLVAKVVGGAKQLSQKEELVDVGALNVKLALETLEKLAIPIVGQSVGGAVGKKVLFHSDTGRLQVADLDAKATVPEITDSKLKVLIVDDSRTIRETLRKLIAIDPTLELVDMAESAEQAEQILLKKKVDVISLDIHMPGIGGVRFLERQTVKIPTIVVSSLSREEGGLVFQALEAGAVDYIRKPNFGDLESFGEILREKLKIASQAKVQALQKPKVISKTQRIELDPNRILAIGASTGGTEAVRSVLMELPKEVPPILIVQHIPPVFSKAFADRLSRLCQFPVVEATDGMRVEAGKGYVAPGGMQMRIEKRRNEKFLRVTDDPPVNRHKPSVDYLFRSVAEVVGPKAVGVILTGMGADGAKGLLEMKNAGALTLAQDEATSVVYGMPKAAKELGAALSIVPLHDIAESILGFLRVDYKNTGEAK